MRVLRWGRGDSRDCCGDCTGGGEGVRGVVKPTWGGRGAVVKVEGAHVAAAAAWVGCGGVLARVRGWGGGETGGLRG
jgi:hypothetical protein